MPVVPGFKYDLFISYAHQNDRPWGWVTEFIETLKAELEGKSRDFSVWWDPGLRTGEDFNIAIADAIAESAVFLSVLSLAYGDSSYCKLEIEEFRQQRHPAFDLTVGSMSRMQAIVIEREFTRDRWAPEFRVTSPYQFFDNKESLFSRPAALASHDPWVQGLWKVRDSIWAVLQNMKQQKERGSAVERSYGVKTTTAAANVASGAGGPVVHIAEVTDDLYRRRENLRTALGQANEFRVAAWSDAAAAPASGPSALSVHLFGKYPGRGFGDSELSLSRLQLEATIKNKPARRPLVWLARDLNLDDAETPEHKVFLESLLRNSDIELLRTDFEDLKEEIGKRMKVEDKPAARRAKSNRESPIIHIWHAMDNPVSLAPLKQYLTDNDCGISVFNYTSFPPEKMQSRLAICDGLIVPYTPETRTWAEDVMTEAFRLRRREERPTAFAAVELPPASELEFNFEHPRVVPVHLKRLTSYEGMDQFLSKLEEAGA
jgi:hypothetical protein